MSAPSGPLLVLGMHRSGTSYLAQVMQTLGVALGEQLVGAQKGNPRGHFEDREILVFHEGLLDARTGDAARAFDPGMMVTAPVEGAFTAPEAEAAEALLAARETTAPWGWKEPRTALFLDGWRRLRPDLRGVVIYRHPWAVHDSMRRREHWDLLLFPTQVLQAYAVYNEALLRAVTADRERFLVLEAESAFADPAALLERLGAFFDLPTAGLEVPAFFGEEFARSPRGDFADETVRWLVAAAADAYAGLEAVADLPAPAPGNGAPEAATLASWQALRAASASWDEAGRALLLAAIESLVFDREAGQTAAGRSALAVGMREALEQEGGWNVKAKRIFEDNQRLHAELRRIGGAFREQQAFLKKQNADFARLWDELRRVGKSWEAQRDYIRNMEQHWAEAGKAADGKSNA